MRHKKLEVKSVPKFRSVCRTCNGVKILAGEPCEKCAGLGYYVVTREEVMTRGKRHYFMQRGDPVHHPKLDKNNNEKFPKFSAEVPPEIAEQLDDMIFKLSERHFHSRAHMVRFALMNLLEEYRPEEEVIEGQAHDVTVLPALPPPDED